MEILCYMLPLFHLKDEFSMLNSWPSNPPTHNSFKQVKLLYDHAVYKPWSNYKKIKHFFILKFCSKFYFEKKNLDQIFLLIKNQKKIGPKIFFELKDFLDNIFLGQTFFWTKIFLDQKVFSDQKIFSDQNFL